MCSSFTFSNKSLSSFLVVFSLCVVYIDARRLARVGGGSDLPKKPRPFQGLLEWLEHFQSIGKLGFGYYRLFSSST